MKVVLTKPEAIIPSLPTVDSSQARRLKGYPECKAISKMSSFRSFLNLSKKTKKLSVHKVQALEHPILTRSLKESFTSNMTRKLRWFIILLALCPRHLHWLRLSVTSTVKIGQPFAFLENFPNKSLRLCNSLSSFFKINQSFVFS